MNSPDPFQPDAPNRHSRRRWIQGAGSAAILPAIPIATRAAESSDEEGKVVRAGFSLDENRIRLYSPAITSPVRLVFVADTHLSRDDARGEAYREFSKRMAGGYQRTKHFKTGADTDPETCFVETLGAASKEQADAVVLAGDLFSFPSEAAVEWVMTRLGEAGLPWLYTAGNHDWHYEGMEGSSADLRTTWIQRRLLPLYEGRDAMGSVFAISGLKVLVIDNSTYEISPEQLEFFRREAATGEPMVLCVHIPLYAPGRPPGFGCGHPGWGAAVDKNHLIERRPIWPERHSAVTMDFHREVFASANLLGVFAGHIHQPSVDVINGVPQVVTGANATGAHLIVEVLPTTAA